MIGKSSSGMWFAYGFLEIFCKELVRTDGGAKIVVMEEILMI